MESVHLLAYEQIAYDPSYRLLVRRVTCPECGSRCLCEGYDGRALVYGCVRCGRSVWDDLPIHPLFAADWVERLAIQHYQISCPFCGGHAPIVGGDDRIGLYFVCEKRCHVERVRYIRRY